MDMAGTEPDPTLKRILVALDASSHSLAALNAAADLAHRLQCELIGMHVEDTRLLRLARSPFARGIAHLSGRRLNLDGGGMERQLRAQAVRIRDRFSSHAERAQVSGSFQVRRGEVAPTLLDAASEVDLVVVGKAGTSLASTSGLGSVAREVLSKAPSLALVVTTGTRLEPPITVVFDATPVARKALLVAASLVDQSGGLLEILLMADEPEVRDALKHQVFDILAPRGLLVRPRPLVQPSASGVVQVIQALGGGTLVVPWKSLGRSEAALLALLDRLENPVLVVH
jgi:nucleotide-binding universal stress UspA family protein